MKDSKHSKFQEHRDYKWISWIY